MAPAAARLLGVQATLDELRSRGAGNLCLRRPPPTTWPVSASRPGRPGPPRVLPIATTRCRPSETPSSTSTTSRTPTGWWRRSGPSRLFGPIMGIPSVVPDAEVTAPGSLTARRSGRRPSEAVEATLVFASPAALINVAATADALTPEQVAALQSVRLIMSAGAPVPRLGAPGGHRRHAKGSSPHPVRHDRGATGRRHQPGRDRGNRARQRRMRRPSGAGGRSGYQPASIRTVGRPAPLPARRGVVGEVCIRAPHMRDGYDKLWVTNRAASRPPGWHRSGDVGHLDDTGRLWIEGRMGDIVTTAGRSGHSGRDRTSRLLPA